MASESFACKRIAGAIAAMLLIVAAWFTHRHFFMAIIDAPPTVAASETFVILATYPGWKSSRFTLWMRLAETEDLMALHGDADFKWDGRYHYEAALPGVDTPGTYNVYLTYGENPPSGDVAPAKTTMIVSP